MDLIVSVTASFYYFHLFTLLNILIGARLNLMKYEPFTSE